MGILASPTDNLDLLIKDPSEFQKYIFGQWLKLTSERLTSQDLPPHDSSIRELKYLYPYQFLITSPFYLPDIEKAVNIIKEHFESKENKKIVLYGDRDADGICSASIVYLFFRDKLGINPESMVVMVPEEEDKYGLTDKVIAKILPHSPDIFIALDNGSSNKESFDLLKDKIPSIKTIIIDHHSLPKKITDYPVVDAFINPIILPESSHLRNMCTSGLAYMFIQAITYSLTSEYDKIYLLRDKDNDIFVKNGIAHINSKYEKIFNFTSDPEEGEDFNLLWSTERKNNYRFSKIADFIEKNSQNIGILEKFQILKMAKMPKILYTLESFLPLAAIGTVADSMLMTEDNRILVSEGLSIINNNKSKIYYGIKEVLKVLNLNFNKISEQDMAFSICPMVNAAGRMGQAKIALDALISGELIECAKNAFLLKEANEKRKSLSVSAISLLEENITDDDKNKIVIAYHSDVHRGISGLLASKLAEKYEKPAMVLVNDGECIRGSIRAYKNENVYSIIHELSPLLIQYGGHIQASGFSLDYNLQEEFISKAHYVAREKLSGDNSNLDPDHSPVVEIMDHDIFPSYWKEIDLFAPFGPGNPRPKFLITLTDEVSYKYLGKDKNHLKISLSAVKYSSIETVWFYFNRDIDKLADFRSIKILAEPQINYFRGQEKYQLRVVQILK